MGRAIIVTLTLIASAWACLEAHPVGADRAEPAKQPETARQPKLSKYKLVREPRYQGAPNYCMLALGQEGKHQMWLVMDDRTLYVDRDGDGDLTGKGEKFEGRRIHLKEQGLEFPSVSFSSPCGKVDYEIKVALGTVEIECRIAKGVRMCQNGDFGFGQTPNQASILHFNGPLTAHYTLSVWDGRAPKQQSWCELRVRLDSGVKQTWFPDPLDKLVGLICIRVAGKKTIVSSKYAAADRVEIRFDPVVWPFGDDHPKTVDVRVEWFQVRGLRVEPREATIAPSFPEPLPTMWKNRLLR